MSTLAITGKRAGLLIALLLPGLMTPASQAADLRFVSWGGAYTRSQMLAFIRPYMAETGQRIEVLDYHGGLDEIRRQVRSLNIQWDLVDVELADAIRGCEEGLFEPIDPATLAPAPDGDPAIGDFLPPALQDCAVGTVFWSTVLAYAPDRYPQAPPTGLAALFDPAGYPGRRGLRRTPKGNLEWALLADGVAPGQVYATLSTEAGLRRALRRLDAIKPLIRWWEVGLEGVRLLETGQVAMGSVYSGRVNTGAPGTRPLTLIWDRQLLSLDLLAVPRGNLRRDQALDLLRYATASERLAAQATEIPYGPARRSALQALPAERRNLLPTAEANLETALVIDGEWWSEHFERINVRFEDWLARPVQVPRQLPR